MQGKATATGKAGQNKPGAWLYCLDLGDEVFEVVVELSGVIDIALAPCLAVAANIGRIDRDAAGGDRLAKRMEVCAGLCRSMDHDHGKVRVAGRLPAAK